MNRISWNDSDMLNKKNMNISGEEEKAFFNNSNKKETLNESDFLEEI